MAGLERLVVLAPFGVYPPRSGGHFAVLEPARLMARAGVEVHLFGLGVRRFEAFRHLRSFVRGLEPGLMEERKVSVWNWLDYLRRGRSGLPPVRAGAHLRRRASKLLRERYAEADVAVYESPWLFPFAPAGKPRVLVAHNDEVKLLETVSRGAEEVRERALEIEGAAWREADLVICLTEEDRFTLSERYGERDTEFVPLGVDTKAIRPAKPREREQARRELGLEDRFVVLFTGAWHRPNLEALELLREWAASAEKGIEFVAAGSVGKKPSRERALRVTGPLPDLDIWFRAADCCVNPLTGGSGANVKLLEYMGLGLPVVTTRFGKRGTEVWDGREVLIREPEQFPEALAELMRNGVLRDELGGRGREYVMERHSWKALAKRRRDLLESLL
jgi:glycosyltransferase involved in cell wall biosynthesis